MTRKDRVYAAFSHIDVDRTPIFEYVLGGRIPSALLGRQYYHYDGIGGGWGGRVNDVGYNEALAAYVGDRLDLADILRHDVVYVCPAPGRPKDIAAAAMPRRDIALATVPRIEYDVTDPAENIRRRNSVRRSQLADGNNDLNDTFLVYEYLSREADSRGSDVVLFAPAYFHGVWTDADLMQAMILDKESAREHFEICTRMCIAQIKKLKQCGVKIVGIGGDFAGNRPIISAECYRTFILPEVKKCADCAHSLDMWAVNASDGDLWYVLDDFLLKSGVDAYMEIDMGAGMHLDKLKRQYGDKITLMGNMDCGNVLSFMDEEEIRALTIDCIEAGWGNGGHVFTASNAITDSVPIGNYLAMVNAYRDYFNMPRISI